MVEKKIAYTNYAGEAKVFTAYFDLDSIGLAELDRKVEGGFNALLARAAESGSASKYLDAYEAVLKEAYCERTEDGDTVNRGEEVFNRFKNNRKAYNALFNEVTKSEESAQAFFYSMMDPELIVRIEEQKKAENAAAGNNS